MSHEARATLQSLKLSGVLLDKMTAVQVSKIPWGLLGLSTVPSFCQEPKTNAIHI